ncbi:sialidase family protein [Phytohabitans rumicis]|uniref:sialidase family protein n=1 Tax=Phytohabitans rumicis TaxID=1076125 RepID=UPI00156630EE
MTGLREMFDEVAEAPSPPSYLVADDVYTAGRRRRTRNGIVKSVVAAVALVAAVGVGSAITTTRDGAAPAPADSTVPAPDVSGPVQWVGAADAEHIYAAYPACPDGSCNKTWVRLVASDDGGDTWQARGPKIEIVDLVLVDRQTLVVVGPKAALTVSVDGGRTWSAATRAPKALDAVPAGGAAICATPDEGACQVYAVDPKSKMYAPLSMQPDGTLLAGPVGNTAGVLWIAGTTGKPCRPTVSMSADGGHTWATRGIPDPPGGALRCDPVRISTTADGRTAYAVTRGTGAASRSAYRVQASGAPELLATIDTVNGGDGSFVAADGTHMLSQNVSGEPLDEVRWLAAGADGYRPITLDGLPGAVSPVRRAADGWFYTHSYGPDRSIYGSTDGRHWSPVPTPGR